MISLPTLLSRLGSDYNPAHAKEDCLNSLDAGRYAKTDLPSSPQIKPKPLARCSTALRRGYSFSEPASLTEQDKIAREGEVQYAPDGCTRQEFSVGNAERGLTCPLNAPALHVQAHASRLYTPRFNPAHHKTFLERYEVPDYTTWRMCHS